MSDITDIPDKLAALLREHGYTVIAPGEPVEGLAWSEIPLHELDLHAPRAGALNATLREIGYDATVGDLVDYGRERWGVGELREALLRAGVPPDVLRESNDS